MTDFFVNSWNMQYGWAWFLATVIGILVIALPLMLAVAMIIYAERKIWAAIALRRGPNVVGPWGLLQSFADGLKVFLKETIIPTSANKGLFLVAPIVTFTVALIVWAVVPFQPGVVLADVNVGLLYILAVSSLGVYGVIVAGWASNSKYPFFSALRAAAQMVSYEVSIGFVLITVVLYSGTFNLSSIVVQQTGFGLGIVNAYAFNLLLFPMWVVFFISSMAETFRTPFDLVEAESELVAGHQTEYSSMSFALFWLGEYANVILMCALNAILFWGGWLPPVDWAPLYYIPGILWLFLKMSFFFFCFGWVKATVPRYRYDQLMRLGWKIFLPLSLVFVALTSGWLMLTRYSGSNRLNIAYAIRPAGSEFVCPLKATAQPGSATLRMSENPSWHVRFLDYSGAAKLLIEKHEGFNRIGWQDSRGTKYRASIQWSNSWGPTGVAATVSVADSGNGQVFKGNCYLNGARA
jgi:NADH-quinone oxidoreductase subunit H